MQSQRNLTAGVRGLLLLLLSFGAVGCVPPSVPNEPPPNIEFIALSAKWCSACRKVPPLFAGMRSEFPTVTFLDLDVDTDERAMKLAVEHDATALPYFLVLVDGKLVAKLKGILPRADMVEFLRDALVKDANTKK